MSQFWTGYHGTGLMLSRHEYIEMLKKYVKKATKRGNDLEMINIYINEGEDYICMDEYDFIRSDKNGKFYVYEYDSFTYSGFYFSPFFVDGKENVSVSGAGEEYREFVDEEIDIEDEPVYFILADKNLCSASVFRERPYDSYEAFKEEFVNKVGAYLPEDFDWDAHLGNFRVAAYA